MVHKSGPSPDKRGFVRAANRVSVAIGLGAAVVLAVLLIPVISLLVVPHPGASHPGGVTDLNVAVVPSADSAGFFVALHEGLFTRHGLHVTFVPAVSSETVIPAQMAGRIGISCGNYVSYIQAQQSGRASLYIFAEGSVMGPGSQQLYVMPGSGITTLAGLEGKTIGVNAPGNILYLLAAAVLSDHGLSVPGVRFAYYPLPQMAAELKAGRIAAAVLPEPFASQAELSSGATPLADLDQGTTAAFPIQGCAVTRLWAARHPAALAAFTAAFEEGQEIADTNRLADEQAMEALPAPFGLTAEQAAIMVLDSYPVGAVNVIRLQRVADVMRIFLRFPPFSVRTMVLP